MRKLLTLILAAVAITATAENRRLLTMEEAILSRKLIPDNYSVIWSESHPDHYLHKGENGWVAVDVRTGSEQSAEAPAKAKPQFKTVENNIVRIMEDGKERPVTRYTNKNIVVGSSVSRNEFGISGGLFPSPDNTLLAFYQKDESYVSSFPLLDVTTRTGTLFEIKYPMNSMPSERVSVGVYNLQNRQIIYLKVSDFDCERYLTNLTWSPDCKTIYLQILDRAQQNMHLNAYCAATGKFIATLLTEHSDKYVEPSFPLYFLESDPDKFIYTTSNRDGYQNLYLCSVSGGEVKRLTAVDADVEYAGQSGKFVYYHSAEVSPVERHLFRVDIKSGKSLQLTRGEGWHNCNLSTDGKYFSDNYSSLSVPRVVAVGTTDGKFYREVFRAADPSEGYNYCPIELGTVRSADGKYDNYYRLIKPIDFDPNKKYPVILYVYGGPHSQMVNNSFQAQLRRWEMYMAQRGYVVFVMDNRGTDNRGLEFEQAIHHRCGVCEMEDQMAGIDWLKSHSWVDSSRIGVHGWSYGGFMTISLMTTYPETFKVGVAGGPVIDWKWYEVMYGERYMGNQSTNAEGLASTSLIGKAKNLKGKLLICQGAVDDVVLWQHSLNFIDECIKNWIPVDYFPYPRAQHNVRGKDRVHLMQKVTDYFEDYL